MYYYVSDKYFMNFMIIIYAPSLLYFYLIDRITIVNYEFKEKCESKVL